MKKIEVVKIMTKTLMKLLNKLINLSLTVVIGYQ